ncbi:hypothetical protein LLH06_12770 [Mucilaginibacter daejeonensis]|uniref:hypothetical protein n=1 Tax=Mucilaginibacter daejeonensis TaxID=398049 RepID=UPI001D17A730|nr:hypothetical protein [Mucilaginibacter daejeonensis]UEG51837.1 hypothetical protein LLH06_12770 [Mucilaginibacter daejeonensis]
MLWCTVCGTAFGQRFNSPDQLAKLRPMQDSLIKLGRQVVNNESDVERKNANYTFIRTLVSTLKIPNSYAYNFDSLKTISIMRSPDNKFRIFSWFVMNEDGSYRFYGAIQMNTGGKLLLHPLEDQTPFINSAEDTITDNKKWLGAQYYKIIHVAGTNPYYVLLGWKGNNVKTTKKVIEVLSFKNNAPVFGMPVFTGNKRMRDRVVFEYSRQASMLLRYVPEQNLIVFDHLAAPDGKAQMSPEMYGGDLSYDGYQMTGGKWKFKEGLDMRNIPMPEDEGVTDPKIERRNTVKPRRRN